MRHRQVLFILLFLLTTATRAQSPRARIDVTVLGPQVGDRVPDFSLTDQNGEARTLDDIMGPSGALILFYRSANW